MTTAEQPALDFGPLVTPAPDEDLTIAEQFERFHRANPHVATALEQLAEQWFEAGHDKVGVKALWERLRWEYGIRVPDSPGPCLNNNFTAFYARLLLLRRPEWSARIATRQQKAVA